MISCKTCEYAVICENKSNNFVSDSCDTYDIMKSEEQEFYESQLREEERERALRLEMLSDNYDFDYGDVYY